MDLNSHRAKELNKLKNEAISYYSSNQDVIKKLEESLNSLFYDSPYDVYGYLSEFFVKYSKPAFLTKIIASKNVYYDSKCQQTFRIDVYCQSRNKEIKILSLDAPCFSPELINDTTKIQYIQEDDNYRATKINDIVAFINTEISNLIKNFSPYDQEELDDKLNSKDRPRSKSKSPMTPTAEKTKKNTKTVKGSGAVGGVANAQVSNNAQPLTGATSGPVVASDEMNSYFQAHFFASFVESLISKAICLTATALSQKEPFEHISALKTQQVLSSFKIPVPLVTILQNGKGFMGKQLLIKEYILMPKRNSNIQQGIEKIGKINRFIRDNLYQSKVQPGAVNRCVTDIGALTCALDTPQQGLEMLENAIVSVCGIEPVDQDIDIAINISASEIFDTEKNKYEIATGALKSADELLEFYADLVSKFPRITMIIEPFNNIDVLAWYKLNLRIKKHCIVASNVLSAEEVNANLVEKGLEHQTDDAETTHNQQQPADTTKQTSKIIMPLSFFKYESSTNVSSLAKKVNEFQDKGLLTGIACSSNETNDGFLADLSVGYQVDYIKIGGFNRIERVNKLNRIIEIASHLSEKNVQVINVPDDDETRQLIEIEIPTEITDALNVYANALQFAEEKAGKASRPIK